jgi:microcin C transport system permease protein
VAEDIPALERFGLMMWDYMRFDFGESYFRSISVVDLVIEKLPVSITLGLWSTVIAYLVSIPLGIRKAVRDGTRFDTWTSGLIIVAYAIPGFLFAILLLVLFAGGSYFQIFPLQGADLGQLGRADADRQGSPTISGTSRCRCWPPPSRPSRR